MKLKIVKSPCFRGSAHFPTLGPSTIYSYLKERGYDIIQEDLNIINHPLEKTYLLQNIKARLAKIFCDKKRIIMYLKGEKDDELENIVKRYLRKTKFDNVDILLISIFDYDYCSSVMALLVAKYFKDKYNNKLVIMGGENFLKSYIYEDFGLYNTLGVLDYYIFGFGEAPIYMLLQYLHRKEISLEEIPGLCYIEGGEVRKNRFFPNQILIVPDFEGLPLECYKWRPNKFFKKISSKIFSNIEILILPFQIIYGCPYNCAFCTMSLDSKIYYFQPQEMVRSLKKLSNQYKTKYFFFMNNTLNFSKEFINSFCNEIIKNDLKIFWSDCASVKHIDGPEILIKMRKAGACRLIFGLETASPSLLQSVNKGITPEHASNVFKWSHDAGIWTGVEIIAGLPHEKEEDLCKTMDFINSNIEYIDEIWLTKFYLIGGSCMMKNPNQYGITNIRENKDSLFETIIEDKENIAYIFDEKNGLNWEDKKNQINYAYNIIDNLLISKHCKPIQTQSHLNILFYLYTHLSEKSEIRYYYNQYRNFSPLDNVLSIWKNPNRILFYFQRDGFTKSLKKFFQIVKNYYL